MSEKEKEKKPQAKGQAKQPGKGPQGGGDKKQRKPKGPAAEVQLDTGGDEPQAPAPPPRLIDRYRQAIVPALQQKFGYKNLLAVPRLEKIVISMGVGKYAVAGGEGKGKIEQAERELSVIAG